MLLNRIEVTDRSCLTITLCQKVYLLYSIASRLESSSERSSPERLQSSPDRDILSPTEDIGDDFVAYQRELSRSLLSGANSEEELVIIILYYGSYSPPLRRPSLTRRRSLSLKATSLARFQKLITEAVNYYFRLSPSREATLLLVRPDF